MIKMKKILTLTLCTILLWGCTKDDFSPEPIPELSIKNSVGLKLQTTFVTDEVSMNVKTEFGGPLTIKIFDISNKVVSKEELVVEAGDNILKVYTKVLPPSAYRIGVYDTKGNVLGITDFNKIN